MLTGGIADGIPKSVRLLGHAVNIDKEVLRVELAQHQIYTIDPWGTLFTWRHVDTHSWPIFLRGGGSYGIALNDWTAKPAHGDNVLELYAKNDYAGIEQYVQREAEAFLDFYRFICREGQHLGYRLQKMLGGRRFNLSEKSG